VVGGRILNLDNLPYLAPKVGERLRVAISEGSRSTDLGMAGRLLREFVISQIPISEDTKKMTPHDAMIGLRKHQVADWVISYLNQLHAFGNEAVPHKTQNTRPAEIEGRDLEVCLFANKRVLDSWFGWRSREEKLSSNIT
jgi:hypothetical protein